VEHGLSDLRVVDLSSGIPGAYCCRLLADAGADVVKVEPAVGDPWRAWSSGGATVSFDEGGALFQFLHHGVRSVVGRPEDPEIASLLAGADVIVDSATAANAADRGFDPASLLDANPGLVVCSITPYGRTGPYADRPTSEFIVQAESGGLVGRGSVRSIPFQAGGRTSEWLAGTFSAMAVAAAARRARRTGRGDHIDFSIAEVMTIAASSYADYIRALLGRPPVVGARRTIETPSVEPTLDGYVGFCTNSRQQFHSFLLLIDRADLIDGDPWSNQMDRQKGWDEWNDIVHGWTPRHTTAEIVRMASELRIPVAPVHSGANILDCDHFQARHVFVDDATKSFKLPRRPWRMDDEDPPPPRPAPRLGEHTGTIEAHTRAAAATVGPDELPLAGVRVLDLTAWWAGPIAAGALAALGADVIHVESISRIDGMRTTGASTGMDGAWWERSAHYLCSNTNKRNLTLDLGTEDGLALLRDLIGESDAVLENFSPRVLGNFGLGWEEVHELNPRCLLVRMPAFGLSGPWRDNVGFAQTMEQVTGMAWITGHRDDQPRIQQGPSDPNAGMHAAFALIVGLAEREATGRGSLLEVTMVEGALNAACELVLEKTAYGNLLERDGNRSPNVAPQGLYRARGDEQWLAISVTTDAEWAGLVEAIGSPAWATDPDLATYAGRRARQDELDDHLSAWSAQHDVEEAAELLVARGVPAAVGRDPRLMDEHPQLQARGFYEEIDHPVVGRMATPTWPFRFASVDRWLRTPAPTLGQHNHDILVDDLAIGEDRYRELEDTQIIGDRPLGV
jgi:crotonobetainyl-CoA:carnitine CoA-transferase CaiB-like acyl-CoA transferase